MKAQDAFLRFVSVISIPAALFGAFIGWVTYALLCDGGCGAAQSTMTWQLVVGVVGLIPPVAMVYFSFTGSNRKAVGALVVGLIVWAAWGVLNDAAVHGWGRDNFLVRLFGE